MILKSFKVHFLHGLHARPAAKVVEILRGIQPLIWIIYKENEVRADSLLEILTLQIPQGEWLHFRFFENMPEIYEKLTDLFKEEKLP